LQKITSAHCVCVSLLYKFQTAFDTTPVSSKGHYERGAVDNPARTATEVSDSINDASQSIDFLKPETVR